MYSYDIYIYQTSQKSKHRRFTNEIRGVCVCTTKRNTTKIRIMKGNYVTTPKEAAVRFANTEESLSLCCIILVDLNGFKISPTWDRLILGLVGIWTFIQGEHNRSSRSNGPNVIPRSAKNQCQQPNSCFSKRLAGLKLGPRSNLDLSLARIEHALRRHTDLHCRAIQLEHRGSLRALMGAGLATRKQNGPTISPNLTRENNFLLPEILSTEHNQVTQPCWVFAVELGWFVRAPF